MTMRFEDAAIALQTPEAFFERAGHRRGNSAGMPVETEDTTECLEPERIGQAPQQLLGATIGNDVRRDFPCETRHACEEPRWRAAGMQRKIGKAGSTGHVSSYEFLWRACVTTVRGSGSNPNFRMNAV